jgi:hypothetical protein
MVKELISGLLKRGKKKEEKKDVPEELPSLAEETVKKESEKDVPEELPTISEPAEETEKKPEAFLSAQKSRSSDKPSVFDKKEVPEELPAVSQEIKKEGGVPEEIPPIRTEVSEEVSKSKVDEALEKLSREVSAKPEEEGMVEKKEVEAVKKEEVKREVKELKEEIQEIPQEVPGLIKAKEGFFSDLLKIINKHGFVKDKLLSDDLFAKMLKNWELRKESIRSNILFSNEQKIEGDVIEELNQLSKLEKKWQVQKLVLEEDKKFLYEREREIKTRIEELKRLLKELKFYKDVEAEHYFYLSNGIIIKNLQELVDVLKVMDDNTFRSHVNEQKNDFSNWVRYAVKDEELANDIKGTKKREEMLNILEKEILKDTETQETTKEASNVSPENYFRLGNGFVVKDLADLLVSLQNMDDATFKKFFEEEKNDVSNWIRDSLKNNELATKLGDVTTKEEMIGLIKVFL